jgi:hypothetical protein
VTSPFHIELLTSKHNRAGFSCGVDTLDRYLYEQASQDMRRRAASCYVAVDTAPAYFASGKLPCLINTTSNLPINKNSFRNHNLNM